jgi:hypothetical protein
MIPAWIAAPEATASSGLTELFGFLPKNSSTFFCTSGILVDPQTSIICCKSLAFRFASLSTFLHGSSDFSTKSEIRDSNLTLVILKNKFLGPLESTVIYGRLISYSVVEDNSLLAFSASSLTLCNAIGSFLKSIPWSFLNSSIMYSTTLWSKSSQPR